MRDDVQQSQDKVPLLGDIPILGRLFRNDSASASKTNLMVFLRATIVRDKETLRVQRLKSIATFAMSS